jgi:hypothetical protein
LQFATPSSHIRKVAHFSLILLETAAAPAFMESVFGLAGHLPIRTFMVRPQECATWKALVR